MEADIPDAAAFFHVRVVIGVLVGLAITRVINRLARLTDPKERANAYGIQIGWSVFILLLVVHFWWFEFVFSGVARWSYELYTFLIVFAALRFLAAAGLFPDNREGYPMVEAYFFDRRTVVFSMLIVLLLMDLADTALKGMAHVRSSDIAVLATAPESRPFADGRQTSPISALWSSTNRWQAPRFAVEGSFAITKHRARDV